MVFDSQTQLCYASARGHYCFSHRHSLFTWIITEVISVVSKNVPTVALLLAVARVDLREEHHQVVALRHLQQSHVLYDLPVRELPTSSQVCIL